MIDWTGGKTMLEKVNRMNELYDAYQELLTTKQKVYFELYYQEREYSRYGESKLIFATIANEDDAVLTISKENKSRPKIVMRADTLSNFGEARLLDSGEMMFNENLISEIIAFEIIPAQHKKDFSGILDKKDTFIGYPANSTTKPMINKLHLWGITEI